MPPAPWTDGAPPICVRPPRRPPATPWISALFRKLSGSAKRAATRLPTRCAPAAYCAVIVPSDPSAPNSTATELTHTAGYNRSDFRKNRVRRSAESRHRRYRRYRHHTDPQRVFHQVLSLPVFPELLDVELHPPSFTIRREESLHGSNYSGICYRAIREIAETAS